MFKFISNKPFWVHLLIVFGLGFSIVFFSLRLLGVITQHGKYLTVPKVTGKNKNDAIKLLESQGFDVIIQDSVYTDSVPKGTVLKQIPDPNSTVKVNRTILLTVSRVTLPIIEMPSLEGKTLRFALELLTRNHLVLGDTSFVTDFQKGVVLQQLYMGNKITPGMKIPYGSRIDLVVGKGLDEKMILVPDVVGMTFAGADTILKNRGIMLGGLILDPGITDTASSIIWKQNPTQINEEHQPQYMKAGQIMDLWLSKELRFDKDSTQQVP